MFSVTVFGNEEISNSNILQPKPFSLKDHFQKPFFMVSILISQANINRFKPFSQCLILKYSRILRIALPNTPINLVKFIQTSTLIMLFLHSLQQFYCQINQHFFHITTHLLQIPNIECSSMLLLTLSVPNILVYLYFNFGRIGNNFPFSQKFGQKTTLKPNR